MPSLSILRPCWLAMNRQLIGQQSVFILRKFSDDRDSRFKKVSSKFDDGLFMMKHEDHKLVLSYWTPLRQVVKCFVKNDDDRKSVKLFDVDQKLNIDDSTPLGTAFQANEKILLKGKDQSILLDFDGSQSGLKKWISSTEIVNNEPVDELERKRIVLLQSYVPMLQNFEKILIESSSSSAIRFKWIGLFLLSSQLGFLGRLIWFEYSWDIMEPITWCVTYSATILTFCYYVITSQEYQYPQAERRMAIKHFCESYSKRAFDLNSFTQLHQQIKSLDKQIRKMKQKALSQPIVSPPTVSDHQTIIN
ncbi:uncharacterized protein LOC128394782 [Panonychus citri]|uniref:uncharacterized protein LOC128394782 n=1 Tax=Panonychus citri TaxID=50023 RepID=UPI002306E016|nr:uncharacterized protein LOC128394782 [Panonychus citri]